MMPFQMCLIFSVEIIWHVVHVYDLLHVKVRFDLLCTRTSDRFLSLLNASRVGSENTSRMRSDLKSVHSCLHNSSEVPHWPLVPVS